MKVKKINEWFEKFGRFEVKRRWFFLIGLILVSVIGSMGLSRLKLDNGEEDWFDDWETTKQNQDHFEDIFGSTDSLLAHIKADDVFASDVLEMIDQLGDDLLKSVPYAKSITSLMELSIPIGEEDSIEVKSPFEDGVPSDPQELARKKAFILSRESLVNTLVSADSTETWLIVNLEHYSENMTDAMVKIAPPAMKIFNDPKYKSDKWEIRPAGMSYTEFEEEAVTMNQLVTRISLGFLVMLVCLIIFIRSLRGIVVPAISTIGALTTTLGFSGWMGIKGNNSMIMVTVLLSMALAVGYSVHYINSFKMYFRKSGKRKESVIMGVRDSGWALFFTVITTMAGMLSFLSAGIKPMRWVGGITAATVFAVFAYIIILLPVLYSFGRDKAPDPDFVEAEGATKSDLQVEAMGKTILNKKWITVIASGLIVLAVIPGIFKIKVNMNYSDMMGERTPYIKRLLEITRSQLGSQYDYEVLIEYADEDVIKNPQVLKKMDILADRIGTLSQTKVSNGKPRVSSVTKIIKEMNRTLNGDDPAAYIIPDDQDLVSQIMFLYEISGGTDLYDYISDDFRAAYLKVELAGYDGEEIVKNLAEVKKWIAELFPDAPNAGVVGEAVQYAQMNGKLVRGSIKSIGTSLIIILILLVLAFTSLRTGFIAMIPNVVPIILIGGVMGYASVNLDMITAMIMPMILGIAVDDTIHFTNHIKYHFELTGDYRSAIENSYREIGKTMIMTTIILCAMFAIFLTSTMNVLVNIGWLSILGLGSALIADYTITPVLIYITKPFGNKK
ncbi:putative exporter of the RND superfamily [Treponema sp. JC4]|uniref:efflux RND transporter permease subunit n=1 Tax=Treponema sp. JC4 TaxID=1124982 RepID=UPI00025B09FF|nr:MMPL family transporter [Treponema sp. JC4]EID85703.1 putative exporter of the RND superfamily [Treponema sp. JC4]